MAKLTRARFLRYAIVVAATVVAVLLVLIAAGAIRLPAGSGSPTVTVSGVHWVIEQGTTSSGIGWFGPDQINYTSVDGYPINVSAGGSLTIPWQFSNFDTVNHSIYQVYVGAPFSLVSTSPVIPPHGGASVPAGTDDAYLSVVVRVPSQAGSALVLNLTVDALFPVN